jgi:hypothetical protein
MKETSLYMSEITDKKNFGRENEIVFKIQVDSKHPLIKSYFDECIKYSKGYNYLYFIKTLDCLDKRLRDQEIIYIQVLKNSMNNKRTY